MGLLEGQQILILTGPCLLLREIDAQLGHFVFTFFSAIVEPLSSSISKSALDASQWRISDETLNGESAMLWSTQSHRHHQWL